MQQRIVRIAGTPIHFYVDLSEGGDDPQNYEEECPVCGDVFIRRTFFVMLVTTSSMCALKRTTKQYY